METYAPAVPGRVGLRRAGWLLALSPIGFVVVTVAWETTLASSGVDDYAFMTPGQLADIRLGWVVLWLLLPWRRG